MGQQFKQVQNFSARIFLCHREREKERERGGDSPVPPGLKAKIAFPWFHEERRSRREIILAVEYLGYSLSLSHKHAQHHQIPSLSMIIDGATPYLGKFCKERAFLSENFKKKFQNKRSKFSISFNPEEMWQVWNLLYNFYYYWKL